MIILLDADSIAFASAINESDCEQAFAKFDEKYFSILNAIEEQGRNIDDVKIFISGANNYRKFIYPKYKANRKEKPPLLPDVYEYIKGLYGEMPNTEVLVANGCEADDMIYASWEYLTKIMPLDEVVVASIDKDLKQIPCYFFDYYYTRMELTYICPEEAMKNFYIQMLTGDATDNINFTKGMGAKTAEKILLGCKTENQYKATVYKYFRSKWSESKARKVYTLSEMLLRLNKNVSIPKIKF